MTPADAARLAEIRARLLRIDERTVAYCERCGRGFIWVSPTSDMIDHFAPQGTKFPAGYKAGSIPECGGRIVMLEPPPPDIPHSDAPTPDEVAGMAWWNGLSEPERADWLRAAGSARPADAWEAWKRRQSAPPR
jgi:hypothetical protein